MWTKVDESKWLETFSSTYCPLFFKPAFLNEIAHVYSVSAHYYLYTRKNKIIARTSFFSKGNRVVTPIEFYYLPFWIESNVSEAVYVEVLDAFISQLKQNFRRIYLKLGPGIRDVRPFIWEGFNVENKFTYVNSEPSVPLKNKYLSRLQVQDYVFKIEPPNESSFSLNLNWHKQLGFSSDLIEQFKQMLSRWANAEMMVSVNVYKQDKILCSCLTLLDKQDKKAYLVMLNKASGEKYAHTFFYQSFIAWCGQNDYNYIDFLGANIKSISYYKSSFGTELVPYFKVSYDPFYRFSNSLGDFIVKTMRKAERVISILSFKK